MAFNFSVDPSGNLISEVTQQPEAVQRPVQVVAQQAGYGMQVDESGNLMVPGTYEAVQPQVTPQKEPGLLSRAASGIYEAFTGESRKTPDIEGVPEVTSAIYELAGPKRDIQALKTTAGMMLAADDQARAEIVKEQFPDAVIETNEQGVTTVTFPNGKRAVINKPGMSYQDVEGFLADVIMFMGPGKLASLGKGIIRKLGIGALAEGGTELARQLTSKELGQEEIRTGDVVASAALGSTLSAAPDVIKAVKKARQAKKAGVLAEETEGLKEVVEEATEAAKQTGVGLMPAQVTKAPSALRKQRALFMLDGGSQTAYKSIQQQDKELSKSLGDFLEGIAPAKTVEEAPGMVREVATEAVKKKRQALSKKAKPFYDEAFASKEKYSIDNTRKELSEEIKELAPGEETKKVLNRVQKFFGDSKTLRIKQIDSAKKGIDRLIEKYQRAGENSIVRLLTKTKTNLLEEADNSAYKKAREIYSSESPLLQSIEKSYLGKLGRQTEEQIEGVASKIFKPSTSTKNVLRAKGIIEKQDPKAWNAILRRRFEELTSKKGTDTAEKVFSQVFANKNQLRQLQAAMTPEMKKRFKYLEVAADRARMGRPAGPDTAFKIEDIKDIDRGVWSTIAGVFTPLESAKNYFSGVSKEQRRAALAKVMFDPKYTPNWQAIRKLTPGSKKAATRLRRMINEAIKDLGRPTAQATRAKTTEE